MTVRCSTSLQTNTSYSEQLALLVLTCSLVSIAVIAIATWVVNHDYVVNVKQDALSLTAALYAAQLLSSLTILQSAIQLMSTRVLIQQGIQRYNAGNTSYANWARSQTDMQTALNSGSSSSWLLQAQIQSMNNSGIDGNNTLLRATGAGVASSNIRLPYQVNGSNVCLGADDGGYPTNLYPNFTYSTSNSGGQNVTTTYFNNEALNNNSTILLGPWILNETFSLMSITYPVINSTDKTTLLAWLTVLTNVDLIQQVMNSTEGLGATGVLLLIGPTNKNNTYRSGVLYGDAKRKRAASSNPWDNQQVRFVLPPVQNDTRSTRHASYVNATADNNWNAAFSLGSFPALEQVVTQDNHMDYNSGSMLDTRNEEGDRVAVGYAFPSSALVDWVLLVEQDYSEVIAPLNYLRNVLIACLFGTLGAIILMALPSAHFFARPIRRLREATTKSVEGSSGISDKGSIHTGTSLPFAENAIEEKDERSMWRRIWERFRIPSWQERHSRRGSFRIPKKVIESKHWIKDELTDLSATFNEMVDELSLQYTRLEERVQQRTAELELSKKAAEAANEAKTLFIANISHELKTPLNGILGMCAVTMHETDMTKVKRSLGIIHKSGDLLLHLLTDLLTFSKNQVGQHVRLEEKEFRLAEISSQVLSIFEQQAREGHIDFNVHYERPDEDMSPGDATTGLQTYGPTGSGRIRDMLLWGDQHRLLQVLINLVSNSLKFTPPGGKVSVYVKCIGPEPASVGSRSSHQDSRQSSTRRSRLLGRGRRRESRNSSSGRSAGSTGNREHSAGSNISAAQEVGNVDSSSVVKPKPKNKRATEVSVRDVTPSPPPHSRNLLFEFRVEDTGPGIPPDQQQAIFEPFVQGDLGLSKKFGGTGLGLSICRQLAKLMKGSITLQSEPGKGSIFTMKIPLRFIKGRTDSVSSSNFDNSRRHSLHVTRNVSDTSPPWGTPEKPARSPKRRSVIGPAMQGNAQDASPADSPEGREGDASDSDMSTHSAPANYRSNLPLPRKPPRLVGLSQPYFATTPPLEDEASRMEAMARVAAEAQKSGKRVRVLVAEDNKINQEVVLKMLRLEEVYDVTVASDGQQAFDYVKAGLDSNPPAYFDLIFMDVQMPNVDGLQSTRLIRGAGYSAPIVALTAFAEESNQQECMDSGMDYFLPKPIRRPALKQVLKKFCPTIPEEGEEVDAGKDQRVVAIVRKSGEAVRRSGEMMRRGEEGGVDLNQRRKNSAGKKLNVPDVEIDITNLGKPGRSTDA